MRFGSDANPRNSLAAYGAAVGLAAARGWGTAFSKPVRGVSTLEAMANKPGLTADWAFPIFDARRGEFFVGCYRRSHQGPGSAAHAYYESVEAGWVLKPHEIRRLLEERLANGVKASGVVRAHDQATLDLRNAMPPALEWQIVEGTLVDAIAALAWQAEEAGISPAMESLDACYIRRPDAELGWKA
jgi:tRNA A37 threonylcarbamoyladenosine modification protein TsaB